MLVDRTQKNILLEVRSSFDSYFDSFRLPGFQSDFLGAEPNGANVQWLTYGNGMPIHRHATATTAGAIKLLQRTGCCRTNDGLSILRRLCRRPRDSDIPGCELSV